MCKIWHLRKGQGKYPQLELVSIYLRNEKKNIVLAKKSLQRKARIKFPEVNPNSREVFTIFSGWTHRFLKCHSITSLLVTGISRSVPEDAFDKITTLLSLIKDKAFNYMDETPMFSNMPSIKTYDFRGVKTIHARSTGYEKLRYSAVLCAGIFQDKDECNPFKLPPMIIFKNFQTSA